MIRYCLEIHEDGARIHRVDCTVYDLATLLGLGCVTDLGDFRNAKQALESIKDLHPEAVPCEDCCKAEVLYLPKLSQPAAQKF